MKIEDFTPDATVKNVKRVAIICFSDDDAKEVQKIFGDASIEQDGTLTRYEYHGHFSLKLTGPYDRIHVIRGSRRPHGAEPDRDPEAMRRWVATLHKYLRNPMESNGIKRLAL